MKNLTRVKKAGQYNVKNWLVKELNLTRDQVILMDNKELIRFGKYEFYEYKQEKKVSPLWRITLIPYGISILLLYLGLPINFLFTGRWGYHNKLMDIMRSWNKKIGL